MASALRPQITIRDDKVGTVFRSDHAEALPTDEESRTSRTNSEGSDSHAPVAANNGKWQQQPSVVSVGESRLGSEVSVIPTLLSELLFGSS